METLERGGGSRETYIKKKKLVFTCVVRWLPWPGDPLSKSSAGLKSPEATFVMYDDKHVLPWPEIKKKLRNVKYWCPCKQT